MSLADKLQQADITSVGQDIPATSPAFKVIRKHAEDYADAIKQEIIKSAPQAISTTVIQQVQGESSIDLSGAQPNDLLTVVGGEIAFIPRGSLTEHQHPPQEIPTPSFIESEDSATRVDSSSEEVQIITNSLTRFTVTDQGHLLPMLNSRYDLGSAERKIRNLYLSDNSLYLGDHHVFADNNRPYFDDKAIDREVYTWMASFEPNYGQLAFYPMFSGLGKFEIAHKNINLESIAVWVITDGQKSADVTIHIAYGATGSEQTYSFTVSASGSVSSQVFTPDSSVILLKGQLASISAYSSIQIDAIGISMRLVEITT